MGVVEELIQGREAYELREWATAYDRLQGLDASGVLAAEDLSRWATAAFLLGRNDTCAEVLQRAHKAHVADGDVASAARCAFWLGLTSMLAGNAAVGGGWFARGWRLLESSQEEPVEAGYLLLARGLQQVHGGELAAALETAREIERIGRRFADANLITMGLHQRGRTLLLLARVPEGVALLDEAMAGVTADDVAPVFAGMIYCSTIEACQEISDFARARQWTSELSRWCDAQPGLVPYTGQCAVHRGQIMRLEGALAQAVEELRLAYRRYLDAGSTAAAGLALYERGEVHRLRGEFAEAEDAFAEASSLGYEPQPGLALLWLAQSRTDAAAATIQRLVTETRGPVRRSKILPAAIEVRLSSGQVDEARSASEELTTLAEQLGCAALKAQAAYARGCVLLAEDDPGAALPELRTSWRVWASLGAPYDAATVRVQIGRACRAVGDEESARLELTAAGRVLADLGARTLAEQVETLLGRRTPDGLTAREVEVLQLVATGKSNPAIAADLFLSEKTVARHLSNIFAKIDVTTRTAAAAYAYEHHLC